MRGGLRLAWLAALLLATAGQLTPIVQQISDVTMKACPNQACSPVNVQITVGHQNPNFDISRLQITQITPSPSFADPTSPLSSATFVLSDGAQRVIALAPNQKNFGTTRITVTVTDSSPGCTVGCSVPMAFNVIVRPLAPVFDDAGPTKTVVNFKTIVGTPTYPYTFLVGHEDEAKMLNLAITGTSTTPDIVPNVCCGETPAFIQSGGMFLTLHPYNPAEGLTFVVGEFVVKARRVTIVIRPSGSMAGDAQVIFRLTDGPPNSANVALSTITVSVLGRPTMEKFCAHDVRTEESLQSIANLYGMHWMSLFMFNNHTLTHPDQLVPGSRLSIGRPYIVKKGDSLFSIATQFGTTWQHVKALNPAIVLDEKSLFEGQLLCLAPDLAFVTCRNRY